MTNQAGAALLIAVLLGVATDAQQTSEKPPQKSGQMSMDDMMGGCREHCQATMKNVEQMDKAMEGAKASTDADKMRTALEQAQKPLADMKEHMGMCMNMMNMMAKMHGGDMGGMMGGMGMMSEHIRIATSPRELAKICDGKATATSAPTATYRGRTYYFCSQADRDTFQQDPEKFLKK